MPKEIAGNGGEPLLLKTARTLIRADFQENRINSKTTASHYSTTTSFCCSQRENLAHIGPRIYLFACTETQRNPFRCSSRQVSKLDAAISISQYFCLFLTFCFGTVALMFGMEPNWLSTRRMCFEGQMVALMTKYDWKSIKTADISLVFEYTKLPNIKVSKFRTKVRTDHHQLAHTLANDMCEAISF